MESYLLVLYTRANQIIATELGWAGLGRLDIQGDGTVYPVQRDLA